MYVEHMTCKIANICEYANIFRNTHNVHLHSFNFMISNLSFINCKLAIWHYFKIFIILFELFFSFSNIRNE